MEIDRLLCVVLSPVTANYTYGREDRRVKFLHNPESKRVYTISHIHNTSGLQCLFYPSHSHLSTGQYVSFMSMGVMSRCYEP